MKRSRTPLALSVLALGLGLAAAGCRAQTQATAGADAGEEPSAAPPAPSAASAEEVAPPPLLPPDAPYEGEIVLSVTEDASGKLPVKYVYDVKGTHLRLAAQGNIMRVLVDLDGQRAYVVDQVNKTFDTVDTRPAAALPKVQKSGKKDTVFGTDCEPVTIDDGNDKVEACVAAGVSFFGFSPTLSPGHAETPWAAALTAQRAFPLRAIVRDARTGKVKYHAEATKVFRAPMDEGIFKVPSTFAPTDLSKDERAISLP